MIRYNADNMEQMYNDIMRCIQFGDSFKIIYFDATTRDFALLKGWELEQKDLCIGGHFVASFTTS